MMRKTRPKHATQPGLLRALYWLLLGGNIVMLLVTTIFPLRPHFYAFYAMSFSVILSSTGNLILPTRPRLAAVCILLACGSMIAAVMLAIT